MYEQGILQRAEEAGNRGSSFAVTIKNSFIIALTTLWAHKLRSSLTLLGIVIGIAAVVLIGATLETVRELAVRSTAQTIGADTFIIAQVGSTGALSRKELSRKLRVNPEIYRGEADTLAGRVKESALTAPVLTEISDIKSGNRRFQAASITGSTPNIQITRSLRLSSGRFFTESESRRSLHVVVIGQDIVAEISPSGDPLGKDLRIQGRPFVVIGVLEKQGASFGSSLDRMAYIPLRAFEKIWGSRRSVTISVRPRDPDTLGETLEEARADMRVMRRLKPGTDDNFDVLVPEAGRDFIIRMIGIISIAIVPISSVALVVAGIVVMNMMLVSVTERTRETGIRKSLGARNRDIFSVILFESTLLTFLGGAAGIIISYFGSMVLGRVFDAGVHISFGTVVLALALTASIGIGAGLFPAFVASRMPPVEALRYET
jgi:putative ABC transport system permease protein